jgi:peptidoglycan hydrolase CwlO-like protein
MIKNIIIVLLLGYCVYFIFFIKDEKKVSDGDKIMISGDFKKSLDSMYSTPQISEDSLKLIISNADSAIGGKISKVTSTIVSLKGEVIKLNNIIKVKNSQIDELKKNISNFTDELGSKFDFLPISKSDK